MQEHEQDTADAAGEAIDEIRRFVWAAGDLKASQDATADRLEKVRGEFAAAKEALTRANDLAQRLAQRGMSIDRSDMDALRGERAALVEAMHQTFGQMDAIRGRLWLGAFGLGIAGGLIGGGVVFAAPLIIRGFMP